MLSSLIIGAICVLKYLKGCTFELSFCKQAISLHKIKRVKKYLCSTHILAHTVYSSDIDYVQKPSKLLNLVVSIRVVYTTIHGLQSGIPCSGMSGRQPPSRSQRDSQWLAQLYGRVNMQEIQVPPPF